jgi:hypothetical protein
MAAAADGSFTGMHMVSVRRWGRQEASPTLQLGNKQMEMKESKPRNLSTKSCVLLFLF